MEQNLRIDGESLLLNDTVLHCLLFVVLPFDPPTLLSLSHTSSKLFVITKSSDGLVWRILYKKLYSGHHTVPQSWPEKSVQKVCLLRWKLREDLRLKKKRQVLIEQTEALLMKEQQISQESFENALSATFSLQESISCLRAKRALISALERESGFFCSLLNSGDCVFFDLCQQGGTAQSRSKWKVRVFLEGIRSAPFSLSWTTYGGDFCRLKVEKLTIIEAELQSPPRLPWIGWTKHGCSLMTKLFGYDEQSKPSTLEFIFDFLLLFPFPPKPTICCQAKDTYIVEHEEE